MYSKCVILIECLGYRKLPKFHLFRPGMFVEPGKRPGQRQPTEPGHEGSFKLTALVLQASLLLRYLDGVRQDQRLTRRLIGPEKKPKGKKPSFHGPP